MTDQFRYHGKTASEWFALAVQYSAEQDAAPYGSVTWQQAGHDSYLCDRDARDALALSGR